MSQHLFSKARCQNLGPARIMSRADFKTVYDELSAKAREIFGLRGEFEPMLFMPALSEKGEILQIACMSAAPIMEGPGGKDELALAIEALTAMPNHDFCVFVHEAWTLKAASQEELERCARKSLEHHPEREEALVFNVRSKDLHAIAMIPILRDGQSVCLGEGAGLMFPGQDESFRGRFAPNPRM